MWLKSKVFVVMGGMDRVGSHGSQGMTSMTCVRKKEESKKVFFYTIRGKRPIRPMPSEASDPSEASERL